MKKRHLFFTIFLSAHCAVYAQEQTIDTVFIFDKQIAEAKKTQQVYQISNADIQKNATNLSEILRFQTPVYIKENGRGAASSPSFRGTTAQQTSVLWNGIPVNSLFLGQSDINNLSLLNYDNIDVKSGGGSVIYGSAAIGGTIHLNNKIAFNKGLETRFFGEYGSYETLNTSLKTSYSTDKFAAVFSAGLSTSKNDYEVPEKNYINNNGEYSNQTFNLSTAYRFNNRNQIYWHTQQLFGDQHYPIFEVQQTKTKYLNNSFRSMMTCTNRGSRHQYEFYTAFLKEEWSYFPDIDKLKGSGGNGKIFLLKNDFEYDILNVLKLNFIAQALQENGEGYQSGEQDVKRWAGSAAGLLKFEKELIYLEAGAK